MLITDIKDKWFKNTYNNVIKISNSHELEKLIKYIEEDKNRYDQLFQNTYSESQINFWRQCLEDNLKKKRFRFISIRYNGSCYNGQNSNYLNSTNIIYSDKSPVDVMLEMIDNYENQSKLSNEQIEINDILNELAL